MRSLLPYIQKPSHYAGIEEGQIIKPFDHISLRVGLAFPDTYEVGMSYLGQKILYNILNKVPHWQAERIFAPELETSQIMKEKNVPLTTLETNTPINKLDILGFSITHELCYPDVLHMLDLGYIPRRHKDRPQDLKACPLVIAGGGAMAGAEAIAPFFDLVCLGDGEELLPELLRLYEKAEAENATREEFLRQATSIGGIYVPSLFKMLPNGSLETLLPGYRPVRRIVDDLNKAEYPVQQVMPVGAVHNRLALEIARGCSRGCRFCHAGMTYRPVRERTPEKLRELLEQSLDNTGFEEISFLSLSTGDFSALKKLWGMTWDRCAKEQVTLSLPSLRVGSIDQEIMERLVLLGRTGCTLAPEAGSQRLRDVINKGITEDDLLAHSRKLLEYGWRQLKLYFMIGLPTETDEDLQEIVDLCRKVRDIGGKGAPKLAVTASISPFVPKPFTPFQWEAQIDLQEMRRRIEYCKKIFSHQKQISLRWHDPDSSHLEGILSRSDRRMADVIEKAYEKGAIFCSWAEHFNLTPWLEALEECDCSIKDLIGKRDPAAILPWDHLETGINKNFLLKEREHAFQGKITEDCRYGKCGQCGVCDFINNPSLLTTPDKKSTYSHRLVFKRRDQELDSFEPASGAKIGKPERPRLNHNLLIRQNHYRIWHSKLGGYAYLSQLELQAAIYRFLRKARLPVAFSQGYHPLPLLSFGRALPVGMESEVEWFGITLHEYMTPQKIMEKLNEFLPDKLRAWQVEITDKKNKTAQAIAETFVLKMPDEPSFEKILKIFTWFSGLERYDVERKTKKGTRKADLRAFLSQWKIHEDNGKNHIVFTTDWHYDYLSPAIFVQKILESSGKFQLPGIRPEIIKIRQFFENGAEFFLK